MSALNKETDKRTLWGVFLLWPFLALLLAVKNFGDRRQRGVILAFIVFFGFTMVMSKEGMDGYRHAQNFLAVAEKPFSQLYDALSNFFRFERDYVDIYIHIVNTLISRVTQDTRWFFAFNALVFGFFYLRTLGLAYDEFHDVKRNNHALLFFIVSAGLISINHIHFVRFWTASWVFLYFAYFYFEKGQKRYVYLSAFSMLFHFGFVFAVGLLLAHAFTNKYKWVVYPIIVVVFVYADVYLFNALQFASGIGEGVEVKVQAYTNQAYIVQKRELGQQVNWYVAYRGYIFRAFIWTVFILSFLNRRLIKDAVQERLSSFILLLFAISLSSTSVVGSVNRFGKVGLVLICFYMLRTFMLNPRYRPGWILNAGIPVALFYLIVEFRAAMDLISPLSFIGNLVWVFFPQWDFVLRDIF